MSKGEMGLGFVPMTRVKKIEADCEALREAATEYQEAVRAWWGNGLSLRSHAADQALADALSAFAERQER